MAATDSLQWEQSKQVQSNLIVQFNGGGTEGTNKFTFNGSSSKTINIKPGTAISFSNTTIGHANVVTAGNAGPTSNATISPGSSFIVPYITYNAQGHVTGRTNRTITLNSNILDTGDILTSFSSATSNTKLLGAKVTADTIAAIEDDITYILKELNNVFDGITRRIETRYLDISSDNTGYKEYTINWNSTFTSMPYCVCGLVGKTKATANAIVSELTSEYCKVRVYSETSANYMLQVIAIGATS